MSSYDDAEVGEPKQSRNEYNSSTQTYQTGTGDRRGRARVLTRAALSIILTTIFMTELEMRETEQPHNLETVSVVTATLNQGHLIAQTIESVLSQKGDFSIEYIVADGKSSDDTVAILQGYKDRLERGEYPIQCHKAFLHFFSEKDKGQSSAMNKAIGMMTGDIVGEISSDDYYLPGAFAAAVDFLREHNGIDLVYGDCLKIYEGTGRPPTFEPRPRHEETFESILSRGSFSFAMQASFFRRKVLAEIGGFFDESMHYCPDLDFFLRFFKEKKGGYVSFPMAVFRIWPGSKTGAGHKKEFAEERKRIAKRFGGNIVPAQSIYKMRERLKVFDYLKRRFPKTYEKGRRAFYGAVNSFRYQSEKK